MPNKADKIDNKSPSFTKKGPGRKHSGGKKVDLNKIYPAPVYKYPTFTLPEAIYHAAKKD